MEKEHLGTIDEYHLYKPIKIVKRPICDKCGEVCSPAGGIVGEVATLWKCYDCNYEVEDVAYLNLPSLNAPTTKGKL